MHVSTAFVKENLKSDVHVEKPEGVKEYPILRKFEKSTVWPTRRTMILMSLKSGAAGPAGVATMLTGS